MILTPTTRALVGAAAAVGVIGLSGGVAFAADSVPSPPYGSPSPSASAAPSSSAPSSAAPSSAAPSSAAPSSAASTSAATEGTTGACVATDDVICDGDGYSPGSEGQAVFNAAGLSAAPKVQAGGAMLQLSAYTRAASTLTKVATADASGHLHFVVPASDFGVTSMTKLSGNLTYVITGVDKAGNKRSTTGATLLAALSTSRTRETRTTSSSTLKPGGNPKATSSGNKLAFTGGNLGMTAGAAALVGLGAAGVVLGGRRRNGAQV